MSEPAVTPQSDESVKPLPTDQKLFYGFAGVVVLVMLGVLVFLTKPRSTQPGAVTPTIARKLGEFSLTDRTGRTVTRSELAGKFSVVNFVHTGCSISCEQVNKRMAEIQGMVAGQTDVQLVSLTVDPRTDTPPVLAEFADKFGADTNRWWMLTGEKTALYELIEQSFLQRDPLAKDISMPGGFIGVERIALVDRDGNVRRFFNGMKKTTPAELVEALNQLRQEPDRS